MLVYAGLLTLRVSNEPFSAVEVRRSYALHVRNYLKPPRFRIDRLTRCPLDRPGETNGSLGLLILWFISVTPSYTENSLPGDPKCDLCLYYSFVLL